MRVLSRESSVATPGAEAAPVASPPPETFTPSSRHAEPPSTFAAALHRVGEELDRGERTLRGAAASWTGGAEWNAGELLSLQLGAYRYSEVVDVASRLVDRAASGVKTVLQGSGQ